MNNIFFALLLCITSLGFGQSPYTPAPVVKENKALEADLKSALEQQLNIAETLSRDQRKIAEEYMENRSEMLTSMLKRGSFIFDSQLNGYVEGIFDKLKDANPKVDPSTILLLSRSGSVNAFTTGDGFFVLNLGLITQLKSEGELAFVIGHELSHQTLDHVNQSLLARAEVEADPERAKEIKRILNSEYQVLTQLQDFVLPGMLASRQFSRSKELEADSLGYLYATSAGFQPEGAIAVLQKFDAVDSMLFITPVPWETVYQEMDCQAQPVWNATTSGSSLGSFTTVDKELLEKLQTHPDCPLRIERIMETHNLVPHAIIDSTYELYRTMARMELIESYHARENIGASLYHAMQLHQDYPDNLYATENVAHLFGLLAILKKERDLGSYLDTYSVYQPDDYGKFLQVLWETPAKDCNCLAYATNQKIEEPNSMERHLATKAITAYTNDEKDVAKEAANAYLKAFPDGEYTTIMKNILKTN